MDEDGDGPDDDSCGSFEINSNGGSDDGENEDEEEDSSKNSIFEKLRCEFNLNVGQF